MGVFEIRNKRGASRKNLLKFVILTSIEYYQCVGIVIVLWLC